MSDKADLAILCEYLSSVSAETIPPAILQASKACLLYGLAVGIASRNQRAALLVTSATDRQDEQGATTRLIDGARRTCADAVFANAALLAARVQGDSHPCGHIGTVVIPAALGAAERSNASGAELLAALICGYESALRIGRDHAADLTLRGFRTTPCYGVFGAAAAAARVARFDGRRVKNAIAFAANFAAGLREFADAGTEESTYQAGFAARNGLLAADVVGAGLEAADSALHGAAGFYRSYGAPDKDYAKRLTERLGDFFEFTTVTFKEHGVSQFVRAIIYGLAELRNRATGAGVASIEIRMHPFEADFIGMRFAGPFTRPTQTIASGVFCGALAWTRGTASFDGLRTYDDVRVNALLSKISIVADPSRARYEPRIILVLDDGARHEWQQPGGDANFRVRWEPACDIALKFAREAGVEASRMQKLVDCVSTLERQRDVRSLMAAVMIAR